MKLENIINRLDKLTFNRMVRYLRKNFLWSEQYRTTKKKNLLAHNVYRCAGCEYAICLTEKAHSEWICTDDNHVLDKVAVDHIVAIGSLPNRSLDEAVEKIFCSEQNLQLLCGFCHYLKTQVDNEETREKKKSLLELIEDNTWEKLYENK